MTNDINNSDNLIDLRDVMARVETLEALRQFGRVDLGNADDNENSQDDLFAELASLETLLEDLKGYGGDEQWRGDWYPVTLIRDSYFVEAMKQLCEDIGDFPNGIPGYYVIDWKATANNLQVDYTAAEFDGVTYWYR